MDSMIVKKKSQIVESHVRADEEEGSFVRNRRNSHPPSYIEKKESIVSVKSSKGFFNMLIKVLKVKEIFNFLMKIINFILKYTYFFNFSKFSKEKRERARGFVLLSIVALSLMFNWGYTNIKNGLDKSSLETIQLAQDFNYLTKGIINVTTGICFTLNLFCIRMSLEASVFFGNLILCGFVNSMYFVSKNSIIYGQQIFLLCFLPLTSLLFSKFSFFYIFWLFVWMINSVLSIPYDYFLVDYGIEYKKFESNLFKSLSAYYSAIYIPSFVMFLGFLLFNFQRFKQLKTIETLVCAIANLKMSDPLLLKLKNKKQLDLSYIEKLIKLIVIKMEQIIQYLPPHLKTEFDLSSTASTSSHTDSLEISSSESRGESNSFNSNSSTLSSDLFDLNNTYNKSIKKSRKSTINSLLSNHSSKNRKVTRNGLSLRAVTIIHIDLKNFTSQIFEDENTLKSENSGIELINKMELEYNTIIEQISKQVIKYSGTLESIEGEKIIICFNGLRNCVQHEKYAVNFAYECLKHLENHNFLKYLKLKISISSGIALLGKVGYSQFRRFVRITPINNILNAISTLNTGNPKTSEILIGENVFESIKFNYKAKQIDIFEKQEFKDPKYNEIVEANRKKEDIDNFEVENEDPKEKEEKRKFRRIYKVVNKKEIDENKEWLYSLEKSLIDHKKEEWKEMWKNIEQGSFETAESLIHQFKHDQDYYHVLKKIERKEIVKQLS